jgi:probable rRNA maturation factor
MKDPARRNAPAAAAEAGGRPSGRGGWDIVLQNPNGYPEARRLRPWLERLAGSLVPVAAGEERSLGVRFVGDRAMRRANRDFRRKDGTTDVLSFPGEGEHLGDILISVPRARRQAAAAGHPAERELQVLLLHGLLHCLGYDHETDDGAMERLERKLRRKWIGAGRESHA